MLLEDCLKVSVNSPTPTIPYLHPLYYLQMNKRKFTLRAERLKYIQSFLSSGKSKKLWCQENEIVFSTFSKWLKEYKDSQDEVRFVSRS